MVYRRRRMARRSRSFSKKVKNQISFPQTIVGNTLIQLEIATAVTGSADTKVLGNEVPVGAFVKMVAVYVNVQSIDGTSAGSFDYYIATQRSGQGAAFPDTQFSAIGLSPVRNQIYHSDMNEIGSEDSAPLRQKFFVKVPKIYQRIRDGDKLIFVMKGAQAMETNIGFRYYYSE